MSLSGATKDFFKRQNWFRPARLARLAWRATDEAGDTFRVVLWQQGRVGISQGTAGAELPPALLSRHDRQVLKSGFRSILRLLEFTADRGWLSSL